jgi:hypothetical protein
MVLTKREIEFIEGSRDFTKEQARVIRYRINKKVKASKIIQSSSVVFENGYREFEYDHTTGASESVDRVDLSFWKISSSNWQCPDYECDQNIDDYEYNSTPPTSREISILFFYAPCSFLLNPAIFFRQP